MKPTIQRTIALLLFATIFIPTVFCRENPKAYIVFDAKGKETTFTEMIKSIAQKQVVFFGEMHNCPLCHWLELEVTKSLYAIHKNNLLMGAEMFEADNQLILDEFMKGEITEKSFESEMRLWSNYSTDYVKLIDFSKENRVPFYATNIPRRYAQIVSQKGLSALDSLASEAKRYIAPLPIPYKADTTKNEMFGKMTSMMGHSNRNPEFMTQAQAVKDATMAWNIARALTNKNVRFLHFNGSFHSDNHDGIIPFLNKYKKEVSVATISCCRQSDLLQLDEINLGRTDFIICIPDDMVNSY